jgi:ABC-type glycerol-3-phosphate transport system substrate-binding protein
MKRHLGPIAAVLIVLAGCSSTPAGGSATPDPAIAFCSSLDAYTKTLRDFEALTPAATVEQYKSAGADAKAALAVLATAAAPFAGAQIYTLQRAQIMLDGAVNDLGAVATPAQVEVALDPYIKAVIVEAVAQHNAMCATGLPSPSSSS